VCSGPPLKVSKDKCSAIKASAVGAVSHPSGCELPTGVHGSRLSLDRATSNGSQPGGLTPTSAAALFPPADGVDAQRWWLDSEAAGWPVCRFS
jgi:hypothetical protein